MNIFEKIIAREIPAAIVYEDNDTLAFMDIGPVIKGHTLVIPKTCYDPVTETPDDVLAKLIIVAKRIAAAQIKGLCADGVNIIQNSGSAAGQVVPHIHFHVIPRYAAARRFAGLDWADNGWPSLPALAERQHVDQPGITGAICQALRAANQG